MHAEGPIAGDTAADKLIEIMDCVPMLRPFLPTALETEDPHRQSREVFERVYAEIKHGVDIMLGAVAWMQYRRIEPAKKAVSYCDVEITYFYIQYGWYCGSLFPLFLVLVKSVLFRERNT